MEPIDRAAIMGALTSSEGQAAIRAMTGAEAYNFLLSLLCSVPTIDASPAVHGRWVKVNDDTCWWYECFRCGRRPAHDLYGYDDLTGYCPHCGARMDGGEDDG